MTEERLLVTLYRAYRITTTGLVLLISGGLTGYIFSLSFTVGDLKTWHASLMTIGVSKRLHILGTQSVSEIGVFLQGGFYGQKQIRHSVLVKHESDFVSIKM